MRLDDVEAVMRIERAAFSDPWRAQDFTALIGQPHVHAFVREVDGVLVGYAIGLLVAGEAEVATLAVTPSARGAGHGRALLDALLALADAAPAAHTWLEVRASNDAAQALYRSRGFTAAGRRKGYYRHPDEDAVVMRRDRAD